jgi:hypothetical protein
MDWWIRSNFMKFKIDESLTLEGDKSLKTFFGFVYIKYVLIPYIDYIVAPIFRIKIFFSKFKG